MDPTAWLYAALLHQQGGEVNDALRAYGKAEARNHQRALYRSGLLLDQDRAVISANRAAAFRDAGLTDFATREAGRALSGDPANASAHLFLAESYLHAGRANLRYETPRVGEYLQANLLAPVGGGVLSANLSQQDYGRLLEQDGFHLFSQTTYRSVGGWEQAGGAFGTSGRIGYLMDAYHVTDPGYLANTDFEQTAFEAQFKAQIADRDTLYVQVLTSDSTGGDLADYTDPTLASSTLRVDETLEPILLAGWHRAWNPEHQTLLLAGWLRSEQSLRGGVVEVPLFANGRNGNVAAAFSLGQREQVYQSQEEWITTEALHLWQIEKNSMVVGLRYQRGELDARNELIALPPRVAPFNPRVRPDAERFQGYVYDTVRPWQSFALTLGLSYDVLQHPVNFRAGPLSEATERTAQASPKVGFVWTPRTNLWLRGAYTRSLGGVSYEQSFRLEPTQVAGFNQAYRSLIAESLAGALSAAEHETWQLAAETRIGDGTFLAVQVEQLHSEAGAPQGIFRGSPFAATATTTPVQLDYEERSLVLSAAQLLGRDWSVFARYRLSESELHRNWLEMGNLAPAFGWPGVGSDVQSGVRLHSLTLGTRFNHPTGWFAGSDAIWFRQSAHTATAPMESAPEESVWQWGVFVGYRFWQRRAEVAVGVENLLDQDYRLHPLGGVGPLARERTAVVRLKGVW